MLCLAKSNNDRIKTAIRAGPVAVAKPPLLSCMICILPRPEQRTLPLVGDCKITRSYKLQTAAVTKLHASSIHREQSVSSLTIDIWVT